MKKFFVQNTPAKGKGVFTSVAIRAGEFIFSFRDSGPIVDYHESIDPILEVHCLQINSGQYIWITQSPQRYVNHSCEPNTGIRNATELYALRNIEADEELTFDYSTTMNDDSWEMDCLCGAPACRVRIRDFKHLPPELQQKYIELGIVGPFCFDWSVLTDSPTEVERVYQHA